MRDAAPAPQVTPLGAEGHAPRRRWYASLLAVPTPIIFIVAAAVAMLLLWRQGGLAQIGASLRSVHPAFVAAILLVYAASILLLALRWHVLVRMVEGNPAWTASAEVFLTSVIVNYAAPIGLAVPTRAALTVRDLGLSVAQSGAVVAWEVLLDVVALSTLSLLWLALGGFSVVQAQDAVLKGPTLLAVTAAVAVAAVVVIAVLFRPSLRVRWQGPARHLLSAPAQRPGAALLALAMTALFWGIQLGVMAALLGIFGIVATPSLLLGVMGLPVLIGMLSPVPGGAGVREALMAGAARLEGVAAGPVVLAAVAYRLALFAVTPVVWSAVRVARRLGDRVMG
jgi:uncharacterized membrane protein YbhN (UPF0104 family)